VTIIHIPAQEWGVRFYGPQRIAYRDKVLGYNPIAYWMIAEAAGATAVDEVNSPAQDGTHTAVTLGQPGIGDGQTSGGYDGATSYTDIYSATFAAAFNGDEGTMMVWARVANAGVWTDATLRRFYTLLADGANFVIFSKDIANNSISLVYTAGGVNKTVTISPISSVVYVVYALTWSSTLDEVRGYVDGVQQGATLNGLGVWAGAPVIFATVIGARSNVPTNPYHGNLAHGILWDYALSPATIAELSRV
jgi:hypothetical protein